MIENDWKSKVREFVNAWERCENCQLKIDYRLVYNMCVKGISIGSRTEYDPRRNSVSINIVCIV